MKGQKRTELGYMFIYEMLSCLENYLPLIERDEELLTTFNAMYSRIGKIVCDGVHGDIIEEYVVTEYEDTENAQRSNGLQD